MGVKVRKRRVRVVDAGSWAEALVDCVVDLKHGQSTPLHSDSCPAQRGAMCECQVVLLGPRVCDQPQ